MKKILLVLVCSSFVACSTLNDEPPKMNADLVWSSHSDRPDWVIAPPKRDDQKIYFVGKSYKHSTERAASQSSYSNALAELIQHAQPQVTKDTTQTVVSQGDTSDTISSTLSSTDIESLRASGLLADISTESTYMEQWQSNSELFFKGYTLVSLDLKTYEKIAAFK